MTPSLKGVKFLIRGVYLLHNSQYTENQCAIWAHQGIARGSMYNPLPMHIVLLHGKIHLTISGSFEGNRWSLEDVKVGGATAEGHILELEGSCGRLGSNVFYRAQEKEVCDMDYV